MIDIDKFDRGLIDLERFEQGFNGGLGFLNTHYPDAECLDIRSVKDKVSFHLIDFNEKLKSYNDFREIRKNGSIKYTIDFGAFEFEMWQL